MTDKSPRNILFIIADQMRADCLRNALSDHVGMPHLQALKKEAVSFANHFSVINPCGPSRASIMTGLYGMNHRSIRNGTPLAAETTNITREALKAGYQPTLLGYNDNSRDPRRHHLNDPRLKSYEMPLDEFDEMVEMRMSQSLPWRYDLQDKGYDLSDYSCFYKPVTPKGQKPELNDPAFYKAEDSDTAFLTNETIRALKTLSINKDQGWFVHLTYIRPHPPLVAPAPYNRLYDPEKLPPPQRKGNIQQEIAQHPFFEPLLDSDMMIQYSAGNNNKEVKRDNDQHIQSLRAVYLGLASEVDAHIGRIIAYLKQSGQFDNTLLIFTSDHGEMLGDRFMWGKKTVYDAAYHIPLIIRDPSLPQAYGTVVEDFSETVDIAPTIIDWMGLPIPQAMNGGSLMPFLRGGKPSQWRDYSYSELDFADPEEPTAWQKKFGLSLREANLAIIREKNFRLVHFNAGLEPLLFDMESEEGELKNLAQDSAHNKTLLRLTQKLLNHRMRHADHTLSDMKVGTEKGVLNFTS